MTGMPEGPYRIDSDDDPRPPSPWRILGWLLLGFGIIALGSLIHRCSFSTG